MTSAPAIIQTPASKLETLKHRFLASLYRGSAAGALRCYHAVLEAAQASSLTETDEKHLRQIQAAVKKMILASDVGISRLPAPLKEIYGTLQSLLRDQARQTAPGHLGYTDWKAQIDLDPWQETLVFETAIAFQLTSGCTNFCRRCNEWALPRIRRHFSEDAALQILKRLLACGNRDLALYGGSDPLDWEEGSTTLAGLLAALPEKTHFSLLTKIPRGKEGRLETLIREGVDIAVSLTNRNRARIEAMETRLGTPLTKQHATPDLLIPACLDEDFTSVKPSITDSYGTEISLDGACIIIPTFTSALHPFGHKKIPVTRRTPWFPLKRLGRPALLQDYFKPLEVMGRKRIPFYLDHLLDVQVENILLDSGVDDLTPPGMRSVKEYFEIFEEKARLKRKAMTLSVVRRLKRKTLGSRTLSDLAPEEKEDYRQQIASHLDFCRKQVVNQARACTAAWFLTSIRAYLRLNPVNQDIIVFLTREEFQVLQNRTSLSGAPLAPLFEDPATDAWTLFRTLALRLVHGAPGISRIDRFLSDLPAVYDPELDRFCRSEKA